MRLPKPGTKVEDLKCKKCGDRTVIDCKQVGCTNKDIAFESPKESE